MPERIERSIARGYERKGYSRKRARSIAIATMIKKGLWHSGGKRKMRYRSHRRHGR